MKANYRLKRNSKKKGGGRRIYKKSRKSLNKKRNSKNTKRISRRRRKRNFRGGFLTTAALDPVTTRVCNSQNDNSNVFQKSFLLDTASSNNSNDLVSIPFNNRYMLINS